MESGFRHRFNAAEIAAMRRAARDEEGVGRDMWSTLRRVARKVPFAQDIAAAWYCAVDPATPRRVKLILLAAVAYFVMPADSLPDILPFLGFTDDAAVIAAALASVSGAIKPAHHEKARAALDLPQDATPSA
jgi:uncharacterized membrane protein YkvA (DUF1232 family)